jgi:NAD(P)-dependent dehydrogenase (short-subunit alcohol dehydrogenase family)
MIIGGAIQGTTKEEANMNKTAIITGGSRGIGFAIVKHLADQGYQTVIVGSSAPEKCRENLDLLAGERAEFLYVQADISKSEDRKAVVEKTLDRFGQIHVLVNNAGVAPLVRHDLLEMTEESYDRVMGINTKGTLFLTQAVARQMLLQEIQGKKRGTIVNISSLSAVTSSISRGEYCVSKAGISMLTLLFADRLAGQGIYVYEVRPGVIETDMTAGVKEKYDRLFESGLFPLARWGLPEDVARAVGIFCSDDLLYTTGNYLDVDGGFHIRRL